MRCLKMGLQVIFLSKSRSGIVSFAIRLRNDVGSVSFGYYVRMSSAIVLRGMGHVLRHFDEKCKYEYFKSLYKNMLSLEGLVTRLDE